MTPTDREIVRHIISLGLDTPNWEYSPRNEAFVVDYCPTIYMGKGAKYRHPRTGILWTELVTDGTHELLPDVDDYALLGWLITELERETGSTVEMVSTEDGWIILIDGQHNGISHQETRIEALTAVLKAAKEAQ
jgi:hypothetical protein